MASGQSPQRRHRRNRSDPVYSNYSYEHILVDGAVPLGVGQSFNVAGGGAGYDEEDLGFEEAETPSHWVTPTGTWRTLPPTSPHITSWSPTPHFGHHTREEIHDFRNFSRQIGRAIDSRAGGGVGDAGGDSGGDGGGSGSGSGGGGSGGVGEGGTPSDPTGLNARAHRPLLDDTTLSKNMNKLVVDSTRKGLLALSGAGKRAHERLSRLL